MPTPILWTADMIATVREMHAAGARQTDIGAACGCSKTAVAAQLIRMGLLSRGRTEATGKPDDEDERRVTMRAPLPVNLRNLPKLPSEMREGV